MSLLTLACAASLFLGIYILTKDSKSRIHILFFIKSLILSSFVFSGFMIQISSTEDGAMFWYKPMIFFMILIPAIFLHAYIEVRGLRINRKITLLMYVPVGILVFFLIYLKNPFLSEYNKVNGMWVVTEPNTTLFFFGFMAFIITYSLLSFYLIYNWGKKSQVHKETCHAKLILFSMVLTFTVSLLCDVIVNNFYKIPHLAPLIFSSYFFSVFYALVKYRFLNNDLKNYFDEILHNIDGLVIILDPEGTIIKINSSVSEKLHDSESVFLNKNFLDVVSNADNFLSRYKDLLNGTINRFRIDVEYINLKESLLTSSYFSIITDKFGDFVGVLVISKENKGIRHFKTLYNISSRQMEIILLSVEGLPNVKISEKLNISRRTVETHLFNIYVKLDIKNKVELIKLTNTFNL